MASFASTSTISLRSRTITKEPTIHTTVPFQNIERALAKQKQIYEAACDVNSAVNQNKEDQDIEIVLQDNIPYNCYLEFIEKHEDRGWREAFILTSDSDKKLGKIVIYEFTSQVYEAAAGGIIDSIRDTLGDLTPGLNRSLGTENSTTTLWSNNNSRRADAGLRPAGAGTTQSLIVEVAFSQRVPQLRQKLQDWIAYSHVAIAIGIKMYSWNQNRLTLYYYDKNGRIEVIPFGRNESNAQVVLPLALLYQGVNIPQPIAHLANVVVDLSKVRDGIYEVFPVRHST